MPKTMITDTPGFLAHTKEFLFPVRLLAIPAGRVAGLLWTADVPGRFVSLRYQIDVVTTTASDGVTVQPRKNGTAINGLLLTLTSANTDATPGYAGTVDATAPNVADDFTIGDVIDLVGVLNVGAFAEGSGFLRLVVETYVKGQ